MEQDLERVCCNFCGEDKPSLFLTENGFHLQRCTRCGLLYVNPRPGPDNPRLSHSHEYNEYIERYSRHSEMFVDEARRRLAQVMNWKEGGKLLDIGCAAGIFLDCARQKGWEVYGVEPDSRVAEYAINQLKLDVAICNFLKNQLPDNEFDAVTAHNIISHVPDPALFFREVMRVLKPGGIFIMHTGNGAELSSKEQGESLGERWVTPDHLYHFSENLLRKYLERAGFTIEQVQKIHIVDFLFSEENLATFKGSRMKSVLKTTVVKVPGLRKLSCALARLSVWAFTGSRLS